MPAEYDVAIVGARGPRDYLVDAIDEWLRGGSAEAVAFDWYRQRRDDHALEDFEITAAAGRDLSVG